MDLNDLGNLKLHFFFAVTRVDCSNQAMAGEPSQHHHLACDSAKIGRIPGVSWSTETTSSGREGQTGNYLQHFTNPPSTQQ